ncbi:hypothetical protein G6F70_001358 [Rhizopus microsporus]|nr:hypothetical protein G6F71_001800 [Rhizopus microsporus]KAG1203491.1 hypothetical protein G6F70_001358 [Rhizopus microsporus]KAG1215124.1 hypothetical protein G6F69_001321 [Rhizopus microsporus]KAG1237483.1 hypothetical protein G6F67_001161 [Rhizopus microsporus]KAG1264539.1 hypothetical protein G6F68_004273 [Rhizopus microsporus]
MDYIIDEERYALETVSSHTQYLHNQPQENNFDIGSMTDEDAKDDVDVCMKEASSKRAYALYTDQDKAKFFKLMFENVMSASAAAKQLGIHVRTAQRWAQMYKTDPDSIFIKHKKTGRSHILQEKHKQVTLEYIDENPSAVLEQVMERLLQRFQDLKLSKSTIYNFPVDRNGEEKIQERFDWVRKWERTDMDFRANCIFLNESAFHINLKRSMTWSKKELPNVIIVLKARAQTTTTLDATSA